MHQDEWERVKEVFTAALEQPDVSRAQFVVESCGDDASLLAEVESLLAAYEEPNHLLEKNTIDLAAKLQTGKHNYNGRRFGSYRILSEIGRGGMGTVFLAERADGEFQQEVALKIIRQSFVDSELERHFRRERQILASLSHPNIAKLIDGGVSDSGELFLAMEFIAGQPLIGFAENHQLTIEERLQLFLKVCRAVSFAHQNLIIHRDLKPSNILVSEEGEPRLLDFDLAKLSEPITTASGLTDADRTETAFRAFTPAYASPEQILGKHVTTASDVFSLGVILYELLTNEKPFHFEGKSLEEIIKTVSGSEPSLPSRIIKSEDSQSIIRKRQLRGDLDNITLKALQKDPARRYQSVAEFANDIERHLERLMSLYTEWSRPDEAKAYRSQL
jgi:serine/threonine protein kinase